MKGSVDADALRPRLDAHDHERILRACGFDLNRHGGNELSGVLGGTWQYIGNEIWECLQYRPSETLNADIGTPHDTLDLIRRVHSNPELVQYVRGHLSQGVLKVIKEYPPPDQVLEAGPEKLGEIPYVSKEKAKSIVAAGHILGRAKRTRKPD